MPCTVCGTGTAKKVKKRFQAKYNKESVEVSGVEMFHCGHCGEDFMTPGQSRAFAIAVKNEVRKRFGLLSPKEIVSIRKKLNLTQEQLEQLLGQGHKVVTRWESGKVVQTNTADLVLRFLDHTPDLLAFLMKERTKKQRAYA